MADKTQVPVLLDKGLDLTTPPLAVEPGSLVDCLNYEMVADAGYKRIDGYERFDGYPNGAVYNYYVATITADVPANQSSIIPGCLISRPLSAPSGAIVVGTTPTDDVGIIVATGLNGANSYAYVPYDESSVLINGQSVTIKTAGGVTFTGTVTNAVTGKSLNPTPSQYISNLRSYASFIRGLVTSAPASIAGMWWFGENLYLAVNASKMTYPSAPAYNPPSAGTLVRYKGITYRVLTSVFGASSTTFYVMPVGTSTTNNNDITEIDSSDTTVTVLSAAQPAALTSDTALAYVVKCKGVADSTTRGYAGLNMAVRIPFDAGTYSSETVPINVSVIVRNSGGTVSRNGRLEKIIKSTGTYAAGNATGYAFVTLTGGAVGGSDIKDNYEIWYNGARLATVNAATSGLIGGVNLAGTGNLDYNNTRYQTITANFYGDTNRRTVYGATGTSRGFWATGDAFGNIWTQEDAALDLPKYVAYHNGRLAFGFDGGSVQESVVGEPLDFSGSLGAFEVATGDKLTGLLELPGDALVAFGKNSIRRIEGQGNMTTISSHSGCYDYTAVLVGQDAMFCGPNGISTLQQSQAYGDFIGVRVSSKISKWLRNRMSVDNQGFETGGVAMAYQVRSKNQYRLVLKNGDQVVVTATSDGYKIMLINYGLTGQIRVPYAWSSAISDSGVERVHVTWDYNLAAAGIRGSVSTLPSRQLAYELGQGWGFDGVTFKHYFDLSWLFPTNGTTAVGVERMRAFGTGYGQSSVTVASAGIETDFDQVYQTTTQDLSLPATPVILRDTEGQFTNIVDLANWGLGIKLRIQGSQAENLTTIEPYHTYQVLVLTLRTEGVPDA